MTVKGANWGDQRNQLYFLLSLFILR